MAKPLFSIRNLSCAYNQRVEDKVLQVDNLDIPRGELIFLLGSSGSGKSTLLEALGLMNNTIAAGEILFHPTETDEGVSLASLWQPENVAKAAEIRKSNYSFIFQNTNLMENFTAYENICLSRMIQDDVVQENAMQGARQLMDKVGLPESQVGINTLSVNLSGGQRQRVAFVRALNADCNVLFGDEPTGNLDEGNANELMQVVKDYLGHKVSAIIVSHDINLALNHAHRIVCLSRNPVTGSGEILPENIYTRQHWETMNAEERNKFREKIKAYYTNPVPVSAKAKPVDDSGKGQLKAGYTSLFFKKEGKALAGKGYLNMWVLMALLFFTFLAIGFANGSIAYLEKKIKNPFVNWLTVTVPHGKDSETVSNIKKSLNNENVKSKYLIKSVTGYAEMPMVCWSKKDSAFISIKGRSIEMSPSYTDPLLTEIVSEKNLLTPGPNNVKGFRDYKDFSLIVTSRFMKDFGYPLDSRFIEIEMPLRDSVGEVVYTKVPIGIRAVVEEIPGKIQMAYSLFFYRAFRQNDGCAFDTRLKKDVCFYLPEGEEEAVQFARDLEAIVKDLPQYDNYSPDIESPKRNRDSYNDGYELRISFMRNPESYLTLDSLYNDIAKHQRYKAYLPKVTRIYNYYNFSENFQEKVNTDELSVNFTELDKVRDFANFMLVTFNDREEIRGGGIIEVDIGKVKEKENFNFLSKITKIISLILILFGTVSVSLFVFNLLKMHLLKVKMNIGTFKAFGLSNSKAQNVYFFIIMRFVLLSISGALLLAFGVGWLLDRILPYYIAVEDDISYFRLIDPFTALTVGLILFTGLLVSWFTIRNMLFKSPGDLIYNR